MWVIARGRETKSGWPHGSMDTRSIGIGSTVRDLSTGIPGRGCRRQSGSWRESDGERWYGGTSGSNGRWWFWDLYCDDPAGLGSMECGPLGVSLSIGGGYCKGDGDSARAKLDEPISDTKNAAVLDPYDIDCELVGPFPSVDTLWRFLGV